MGKGSNAVSVADQTFTWEQVQEHDKRSDKWLVIDNEVYDITEWASRHPGGSKVISHYAGQDATVRHCDRCDQLHIGALFHYSTLAIEQPHVLKISLCW